MTHAQDTARRRHPTTRYILLHIVIVRGDLYTRGSFDSVAVAIDTISTLVYRGHGVEHCAAARTTVQSHQSYIDIGC